MSKERILRLFYFSTQRRPRTRQTRGIEAARSRSGIWRRTREAATPTTKVSRSSCRPIRRAIAVEPVPRLWPRREPRYGVQRPKRSIDKKTVFNGLPIFTVVNVKLLTAVKANRFTAFMASNPKKVSKSHKNHYFMSFTYFYRFCTDLQLILQHFANF